jgi:anti-sigma regulatory factor (Ser/Thr protein kinase)
VANSRLRLARDPALALIVRIFVGSVAGGVNVSEPVREDLRLAASELFAGAVEAGAGDPVTFEVSSDDTSLELSAEDVDPDDAAPAAALEGGAGRSDLIRALFPDAEIGTTVRIRIPLSA